MLQRPRQGVNRVDRIERIVGKDQVGSKGANPREAGRRAEILVGRFGETE